MRAVLLVIASVVSMLGTSCATSAKTATTDPLVGHWRYADASSSADYVFAADGTFDGSVTRNGRLIWRYAGNWSRAGNVLNYTYTKSSAEWAPPGTRDQDTLVKVDSSYYVIRARDGSQRKYVRVE